MPGIVRICGILFAAAFVANCLPLSIDNTLDDEEILDDDDSTTHTLERLSSAATCLVAGVEYTHGQQIYRKDQCEFCLCLDGEMFCWWQDCPPTLEGPCRDRNAFSPCLNGERYQELSAGGTKPDFGKLKTTTSSEESVTEHGNVKSENSAENTSTEGTTSTEEIGFSSTTKALPKICIVMGREYKVGEKLPHSTGNCVECVCGAAGQVTCSPNQCAPLGDDVQDYRPPGPRNPLADMF